MANLSTDEQHMSIELAPGTIVLDGDVPRVLPRVVDAVVGDQVVVLDRERQVTHVLNASAALIWLTIDGVMDVSSMIHDLEGVTTADASVVEADVRNAISTFIASDLVTIDAEQPEDMTRGASRARRHPAQDRVLDGIEWARVLGPIRAVGVPLVVRTNAVDVGIALENALGPLGAIDSRHSSRLDDDRDLPTTPPTVVSVIDAGRDGPRRYRLFVDGERRWQAARLDAVAPMVMAEINQLVVDGTPGRLLFHAGAVERDGRVIVVAGDSGRGKSTLTAALAQRGFAYLTDEVVAVDPHTLTVAPYPKPIDLDARSAGLLGLSIADHDVQAAPGDGPVPEVKTGVAPSRFGAVSTGGTLALFVILGPQGDGDAGVIDPPTTPIETLLEVIGAVFPPTFDDAGALQTLSLLPTMVPMIRLPRGRLEDALKHIEARFTQPG